MLKNNLVPSKQSGLLHPGHVACALDRTPEVSHSRGLLWRFHKFPFQKLFFQDEENHPKWNSKHLLLLSEHVDLRLRFPVQVKGGLLTNALAEGGSIRILEKVLSMCGNVLLCVSLKPIICQGNLLNWKKKSPSKHKHSWKQRTKCLSMEQGPN